MSTADIFQLFQDTILHSKPLIHSLLAPPPKGSISERVAIYVNGYFARLKDTLKNDYPDLMRIMGPESFSHLSECYIHHNPSTHYSLNYYGQYLSDFLFTTAPYNKKNYLAEIAHFEWYEYLASVALDRPRLTLEHLEQITTSQWPSVCFYLHPSCYFHNAQWNSMAQIERIRSDQKILRSRRLKYPQNLLIWNVQQDIHYHYLDPIQNILLQQIAHGAPFIELCAALSEAMDDSLIPNYIVNELRYWVEWSVFSYSN